MKQGVKKKKSVGVKFISVKISRITYDKIVANKEKNRTPISAFVEMAVDEKLARQ